MVPSSRLPPALLTMPSFNGTLAAVRSLGKRGVPVTVAGGSPFAPARWSRYVERRVGCPSLFEPERFLNWLLDFGARHPGHVLYPSCDELAWLFAHHADRLGQHFLLYQPSSACVLALLDKKALGARCAELGVPTPRTAFPQNVDEAMGLAEEIGFPLLLKPRTQMFLRTRNKGGIVEERAELRPRYAEFVARNRPHPLTLEILPGSDQPMLQALVPSAAAETYSLAGFVAQDGQLAVRAALKVLQRPRRIGVGVCFEDVGVELTALEGLRRLCAATGYFGVFEAEFVRHEGTLELVDFNPRFYGQMGFESARELDLPYLAWLAAVGDGVGLAQALAASRAWEDGHGYVYCDRFFLDSMLLLQTVSGSISADERRRWRQWLEYSEQRARAFDAFESPGDPWPAVLSKLSEIGAAIRHPRSFYRKVVVGGIGLVSSGIVQAML
jgi:D-aspartate ligase